MSRGQRVRLTAAIGYIIGYVIVVGPALVQRRRRALQPAAPEVYRPQLCSCTRCAAA